MIESLPIELPPLVGGAAMYLVLYFFGWRAQRALRHNAPSLAFAGAMLVPSLCFLFMAIIASVHAGTPLRELHEDDSLPNFVRDGYWLSIFFMALGLFELLRAWLRAGR